MQKVSLQKTGSGQLYAPIPRFIENHFGLEPRQEVWVDIEGDRIVIFLKKPERSVGKVVEHPYGGDKKKAEVEK